jgi:protein-S-isoprenylcysteine O-methyltransferase Ste14
MHDLPMITTVRKGRFLGKDGFYLFIENFVFPVLFLFFACVDLSMLYQLRREIAEVASHFWVGGRVSRQGAMIAVTSLKLFLFASFNLLAAWSLMIRRSLHQRPQTRADIYIPFAATFSYLLYDFVPYFPQAGNLLLVDGGLRVLSTLLGSLAMVSGLVISVIALYNLRHSFAIFTEVRDIVKQGLYRSCRHPMYLGYIVMFSGRSLASPRLYYAVITALVIALLLIRALLEEKKHVSASEDYKRYQQEVPFLIPSFSYPRSR